MKTRYPELMEQVLSAYTVEHIRRYFEEVKQNGLREHGFPRLTANIGILIAHGRRQELLPLFREMMEFCCSTIPHVRAANDFSVREIVCCIWELEQRGGVEKAELARWKGYLAAIDPYKCYNIIARAPTDPVRNWALFSGVSEFYRQELGLCDSMEFIETQLASQLQWLDENGMYMDNEESDVHQPMVYDLVPRGLFCMLLHAGYRGRYYERIDECLKKAGLLTLKMQSVTGELAFGGRSNQFLHNEAWMATVFEFEAARWKQSDPVLAGRYKAAARKALDGIGHWLEKWPISHIKNRFPLSTKFGCEKYAYFDKYMITAASFLYTAYMVCDDSVAVGQMDTSPMIWSSSRHFHKTFLRGGGYFLELDTDADPHYDASGLGRVHREGAPSAICLSVPCPATPSFTVDVEPVAAAICPGVFRDGLWRFSCDSGWTHSATEEKGGVTVLSRSAQGDAVTAHYAVGADGVEITLWGDGKIACMLPAFSFDGETHTELTPAEQTLDVAYERWHCRYTTDGILTDTGRLAANRNGHYRLWYASGREKLCVRIRIEK